jgi:hypothetical protein
MGIGICPSFCPKQRSYTNIRKARKTIVYLATLPGNFGEISEVAKLKRKKKISYVTKLIRT